MKSGELRRVVEAVVDALDELGIDDRLLVELAEELGCGDLLERIRSELEKSP